MKKIFTLIAILGITVSAMAQNHGAMNFVGTGTFYVVGMESVSTTQSENDKVVLTLTGDGNKQAEIVIPDMNYSLNGSPMNLKSFTANSGVEYTMTGSFKTGDMAFEWAEGDFTATTTGADGYVKNISGKISAKYAHSAQKLEVSTTFNYGVMPFPIHYEIVANYVRPTGIDNVNGNFNGNDNVNVKVIKDGKIVIYRNGAKYTVGGKKYLR